MITRMQLRKVIIEEERGVKVRVGLDMFEEKVIPHGADFDAVKSTLVEGFMGKLYGGVTVKLAALRLELSLAGNTEAAEKVRAMIEEVS